MKTIIIYYSLSGHTGAVAKTMAAHLGECGLFELKEARIRAKMLTRLTGLFQAFLKKSAPIASIPDMRSYDMVILGTPIWSRGLPPAVRGFLETAAWQDIQLNVFVTYRYGGDDDVLREISTLVYERGGHVPQTMSLKRERFFGVDEADIQMALRNWTRD